ncbi:hypothetical protein KFL_002110090 [Klebsormidium nitens]|uniref:Nucleic acid binding protein n=1 Tax=Klebsormidium nitens TaxID=105231 RepID=A0A1Y1I6X2_KLENI|nr:hypothetical protein KFL_002110090 [Klebsormidium nitens]|eukprot:GAQ84891.1 hypothetical protein KFL_002110090 [Klebsormidium nitens]
MRSSGDNTGGQVGGAATIQPDQNDGKGGKKRKELNADPSDDSDSSDVVRREERAERGGLKKSRKHRRKSLESSPQNDDDRERDRRKRRRKREKERDFSSASSSDDDVSSEEEERRRRKRHRRRKTARKRRETSSSASESDEDTESDRKSRRRRKKRARVRESESESTDSEGKLRKKKGERGKKSRDKSKAPSEADRKKLKKEKKKKKKEKLGSGAVTDRYGKYGLIREVDMWNKRPEFGAWLSEVKHINIETLPNREERELFKDFMEDYNTATLPSKKYYNIELHHRNKVAKMHARGQQVVQAEKVVFDDEAEKRVELQRQRDLKKEEDYQAYKASMAAGMAQDMREQDHLRNEMQYQYRLGNMEAVDTIKRRLAPEDPNTVVP